MKIQNLKVLKQGRIPWSEDKAFVLWKQELSCRRMVFCSVLPSRVPRMVTARISNQAEHRQRVSCMWCVTQPELEEIHPQSMASALLNRSYLCSY